MNILPSVDCMLSTAFDFGSNLPETSRCSRDCGAGLFDWEFSSSKLQQSLSSWSSLVEVKVLPDSDPNIACHGKIISKIAICES